MDASAERILEQALTLPAVERIGLVDRLLGSLDQPDPAIDAAWAEEIKQRQAAYKAGECSTISLEEIDDRFRKK